MSFYCNSQNRVASPIFLESQLSVNRLVKTFLKQDVKDLLSYVAHFMRLYSLCQAPGCPDQICRKNFFCRIFISTHFFMFMFLLAVSAVHYFKTTLYLLSLQEVHCGSLNIRIK